MACSCNCSPCSCSPAPVTCCTPTTESVEYTFENGNLVGVGVFDNDTANLVQFRGIVSDSSALTVTLDAGDKAIVLSFDAAALVLDIPDATTTQRGILETATNAEAIAKAATDKILTPSNLAAIGSSTTFAGLVELATNAETQAGISATLAVTPSGLASTLALSGTTTWADAVARAAATPSFEGQIGVQLDTNILWFASGTGVGDFNLPVLVLENSNVITASTTINMNGGGILITRSGSENFEVNARLLLTSLVEVGTAEFTLFSTAIPANSVVTTGGAAGFLSSALIDTFLSEANTEVYGAVSGTVDRSAYATYAGQTVSNPPTQAEMQALDDAVVTLSQIVGALITDLMATLKPHAT